LIFEKNSKSKKSQIRKNIFGKFPLKIILKTENRNLEISIFNMIFNEKTKIFSDLIYFSLISDFFKRKSRKFQ